MTFLKLATVKRNLFPEDIATRSGSALGATFVHGLANEIQIFNGG